LRGGDDVGFRFCRSSGFHDGHSCDAVGWPSLSRKAEQGDKARANSGPTGRSIRADAFAAWILPLIYRFGLPSKSWRGGGGVPGRVGRGKEKLHQRPHPG
jgi:hypothetical protein